MGIFQVHMYTRGPKEDLESVFKKIAYEHTSDLIVRLSMV